MSNTKRAEITHVFSALAIQGDRVTGKAAKERPKKERNKHTFDYYLRKAEYHPDITEESGNYEKIDTMA